MSFKVNFLSVILLSVASMPTEAICKEIIFKVLNNTESNMINLQIAENGVNWLSFKNVDLKSGSSADFSWNALPNDKCKQFIRGYFHMQKWSNPVSVNFCQTGAVTITFGSN